MTPSSSDSAWLWYRRLSGLIFGRDRRSYPPWWMVLWASAVVLGASLPLVYLFTRGATGSDGLVDFLSRPSATDVILRTAVTIIAVTFFSLLVALPCAWLTMRTDLPFRRILSVLLALPLVVPSFVMATTLAEALGPRGSLQRFLEPLGVDRLPSIYGLEGATLVLVLMSYPYIYLTLRGAIAGLNPELWEACRSMGCSALGAFRRVTLPLLLPALSSGSVLAALYTLSDFGGVALMRHDTLTVAIMTNYQTSVDRASGAAMSVLLVLFVLTLLLAESAARVRRRRYDDASSGAGRAPRRFQLGLWKWPLFALTLTPVLFGVILPAGVLLNWLLRGISRGEGIFVSLETLLNSLQASTLAALATLFFAFPVAFLTVRYRSRFSSLFERVTYIGFGLPGVVVALSLVFFAVNVFLWLYQSMWLLVFAYVVLFLPAGVGSLRAGLLQVSPRLEEAARSLGKGYWETTVRVTLPIVAPSVLAGGAMVFLLTMKELPATLILGPTGFDTLATSIWSASTEAFFTRTAASSLILIMLAGLPTAWLVLRPGRLIRDVSNGSNPEIADRATQSGTHEIFPIEKSATDSDTAGTVDTARR